MTTDREDTSSLAAKAALLHITGDSETEQKESKEKVEAADASKKDVNSVPDVPDYPSCDYCGDEFAGKLFCSQCRCAYYCSKKCQKKHWKAPNGHKAKCTKMEKICKTKAESFIRACGKFRADVFGNFIDERYALSSFEDLSGELDGLGENGPYKKALDLGLNEKLLQLFTFELGHVKQNFQRGLYISIVPWIFFTLFRGGRNIPDSALKSIDGYSIDGYRIKQYLRSNDRAFEIWFKASLQVIEIFQTQGLDAAESNDLHKFGEIQEAALAVTCGWERVFKNKKVSKVILLGSSKKVDDTAKERAMWIMAQMSSTINNFPSIILPDEKIVESQTVLFTAMIQLRMQQFGIDIGDFFQLLDLKDDKQTLYETVSIPFAESYL